MYYIYLGPKYHYLNEFSMCVIFPTYRIGVMMPYFGQLVDTLVSFNAPK